MSKTAEQILASYGTASLIGALRDDLPRKITQLKEIVRTKREEYLAIEQDRQLAEADIATDIAAEVDPNTGKAKYSNEKTRAAELLRRKAEDEDYQVAERAVRGAKMDHEAAQDQLDELVLRNRNYQVVLNVIAAELNLLASYYELPLEPVVSSQELAIDGNAVARNVEEAY